MKNKKVLLIGVVVILMLLAGVFFFTSRGGLEKQVLNKTYDLSKEYLSLRYRTDNILLQAKEYLDYKTWNTEMTNLIKDWEDFENKTIDLEKVSNKFAEKKEVSFNLIENVYAYDKSEITRVFDEAPAGKKIATLAKHLGVDAKRAYALLKQDQDQVTADAWNEAGDTFKKLETSATVIKDGCKVAGFVGGVILSGGTAGLATATTLTKATVVITGADLILEVTDDAANIALGDKNGISAISKNIRTVTEPVANIMAINNVPSNLGNAFGKFDSIMLGLEKFRETAQEGKVVGIQLVPAPGKFKVNTTLLKKYKEPIYITKLEAKEIDPWLKEQELEYKAPTKEEIEEIIVVKNVSIKETKPKEETKKPKEEEKKKTSKTGVISYSEWNAWGDETSRYKNDLIEKFGEPFITQTNSGKELWIYYNYVYYDNGTTCSPVYTFYSTDQTQSRRCVTDRNLETIYY